MNLLLDTHTFLWWDNGSVNLSPRVLSLCRDPTVILYLSLVSLWEIQLKSGLRKLSLRLLPITLDYCLRWIGCRSVTKTALIACSSRRRRSKACRSPVWIMSS